MHVYIMELNCSCDVKTQKLHTIFRPLILVWGEESLTDEKNIITVYDLLQDIDRFL